MKPASLERHLTFRQLEDRIMPSGIPVASLQYDTALAADTVLRAEPVELLKGTAEFNGSQTASVADSPVFTDGSFALEATVRPNSIREQVIFSKYNTQQSNPDQGFLLSMLADGRLQFIVYQEGGGYRIAETNEPALVAGTWQRVLAGFDIENQQMSISVNGKEVPLTVVDGSVAITKIRDGTSALRVGVVTYGSGDTNKWGGEVQNARYWPIAPHAEQAAATASPVATDAAIAEVAAEEETIPETMTMQEQQITSAAINAVLRAEPVELLKGTKEFNGSQVENIADSPVFTDGSFTIETMVRADVIRSQTIISKYDSRVGDKSFFLGTLGDGRLQFVVYGDGGLCRVFETNGAPLSVGTWQRLRASFDRETQQMSIFVDGKEVPGTVIEGSQEVKVLHDGTSSVQLGASTFGGGPANYLKGALQNMTFYAVAQFGIPEEVPEQDLTPEMVRSVLTQMLAEGLPPQTLTDAVDFGSSTLLDGVWTIDLPALGGTASLASWQGHGTTQSTDRLMGEQARQAALAAGEVVDGSVPFTETWMSAQGELVGIDLSDTEQAVQSVDLNVRSNQPANTIQAIAYRGEERIAAQAVAENGSVHFESDEGITSVLFVQSDPNATLYVTSMSVSGQEGSAAPASTVLSPMSNADVAKGGARQWEHGNFNPGDVAVRNGVLMNRGGYENRVNGSMLFQSGIPVNSQTQYTRYDLYATSGGAGIAGLWYADFDGLHRVPQEYWTVMGNCLITAPGGPGYIIIEVSGNGTFDVRTSMADRATDVMPSQEMQLRSNVVTVRKTGPTEGFCTVPPGVSSENAHATAGGTVNMFYQILNDGLGTGPIVVRIHVGQSGGIADPVQREFMGELRGLTAIGLSVNVTLTNDNDIATMEVLGANGQSTIIGRKVRPEHGGDGTTLSAEQQEEHLARATDRVRQTLVFGNTDPRVRIVVAAAGQPNIQRERQEQLADGTTTTTITVTPDEVEDTAEKVLVAMRAENLFPDVEWATHLRTTEEIAAQNTIENYVSSHTQELKQDLVKVFTIHGKTTQEAEQVFQWLASHPTEIAAYQSLYAQADPLESMFASLCDKIASGIVSIRSVSLPRDLDNPVQYEYLEHAIDLTTPGIRIIGHPVTYGVETPFWHSSLLLVPEHPERFANLGLKDEAGNPVFVNGQMWVTLGISGEGGFDPSNITFGKEVSEYNRKYDDPIHMPNTFLADISIPQGTTVDDLIEKIIRADMRYQDDANYDAFPSSIQWKPIPGYNCNSFTTAMLLEAGVSLPPINKFRSFPAYGEVPLPVPAA